MTPKPMTPAVEAVSKLLITGNITPHVWYQRTEFRTDNNRPDRNMITVLSDIVYWYRPKEIRDEDTGVFTGYERKFARDMLQYDYARRAAVFGMSKREMQETCNKLSRRGLIRIEYRTENFRGKALSNIVYIEPVAEAIALTLTGPNVESVEKTKGAPRGVHAKKALEATYNPDAGVDDQTPPEVDGTQDDRPSDPGTGVSQNFGTGGEEATSQNFGTGVSQKTGTPGPENWDTYHETSLENSSPREFNPSSTQVTGDARTATGPDDDDQTADAGTPIVAQPSPATGGEATAPARHGQAQVQDTGQNPATSTEPVPRPAAPGGSAILTLTPIPRAELEARPRLDPERNVRLRALMQHTHKSKLPALHIDLAKDTPGGIPRELLTRLTYDELDAATAAAQADQKLAGNFAQAAKHALDRLIGEPVSLSALKGESPVQPDTRGKETVVLNGASTRPAVPEPDVARPDETLDEGSRWEHKRIDDKVVTIVALHGGHVELHNGETMLSYQLTRDYRRVN